MAEASRSQTAVRRAAVIAGTVAPATIADGEKEVLLNRLFPDSINASYTRKNLAAAYRMTALLGMDDLVWNHISARESPCSKTFLITSGEQCYEEMTPESLVESSKTANETGDVIHGSLYASRPDVMAVIHTHTPAIMAVAALQEGLRFLSQDSLQFYERVGYHKYEGISDDRSECARIAAAFGPTNHTLIMHNHGAITVGRTVEEAWVRMYYLDIVCRLQISVLNQKVIEIPRSIALHGRQQAEDSFPAGAAEWVPLLRRLLRNHVDGVLRVSGHRV